MHPFFVDTRDDSLLRLPWGSALTKPLRLRSSRTHARLTQGVGQSTGHLAIDSQPSLPSAMLSQLDRHGAYQLASFLTLHELASLHGSCTKWREWLHRGDNERGSSNSYELCVDERDLDRIARSWVRPFITHLFVDGAAWRTLLPLLVPFHRVTHLALAVPRSSGLRTDLGEADLPLLSQLGAHITHLSLDDPAVILPWIKLFPMLECLHVETPPFRDLALDYNGLQTLPRLRSFSATFPSPISNLSRSQLNSIARCRSLTHLSWFCAFRAESTKADLERDLVTFIKEMLLSGTRLTEWNLSDFAMNATTWEAISQIPTLTELMPYAWDSELSDDHWRRLLTFPSLRRLRLSPDFVSAVPLKLRNVLDALLRCSTLEHLSLLHMRLDEEQLISLMLRLPRLVSLDLDSMEVASPAPLALSPRLTHLRLRKCTSFHLAPHEFRVSLPVLPTLQFLTLIQDTRHSKDVTARLDREVVERQPSLSWAHYRSS